MFEDGGIFAALGHLFRINLVVDANVVIADLRWLVLKRKNPEARPQLLEVLQAETIKAFAPTFLEEEIKSRLPLLASEENLQINELETHWSTYKALITFVDVGGPVAGYQDPKDVPYLKLQSKLEAPILSKDPHISRMGGQTVGITVVAKLRTYSREAAIEYTLKAGGASAIVISAVTLRAIGEIVNTLLPAIRRIPPWVWITCLALIAAVLIQPNTRARVVSASKLLSEKSMMLGTMFFEFIGPLLLEHERAKKSAMEALSNAQNEARV